MISEPPYPQFWKKLPQSPHVKHVQYYPALILHYLCCSIQMNSQIEELIKQLIFNKLMIEQSEGNKRKLKKITNLLYQCN